MLGGILAASVVGLDTNRTLAYQAFAFLVALLAAALLASLTFRGRFTVRRVMPRFGTAGEPLAYRSSFDQRRAAASQRGLTLLEHVADPRPSLDEFLAAREPGEERRNWFDRTVGYPRWMWLIEQRQRRAAPESAGAAAPAGRERRRCASRRCPVRRGRLRLVGRDPRAARSLRPLPRASCVCPRPSRSSSCRGATRCPIWTCRASRRYQQGGVALAASVGDSEEFASLRDYRPGDPLRRIHWRSWARVGRPIVKEYQDEFFVRHALVLDTFGRSGVGAAEIFEEAVSVAASFAVAIPSQDSLLDLMFVGPEAYRFTAGRGLAHADRMLEVLAGVEPCAGKPFRALRNAVLERHGELSGAICVLLDWDAERRAFVDALRRAGVPTLTLVVTRAAPSREDGDPASAPPPDVGRSRRPRTLASSAGRDRRRALARL